MGALGKAIAHALFDVNIMINAALGNCPWCRGTGGETLIRSVFDPSATLSYSVSLANGSTSVALPQGKKATKVNIIPANVDFPIIVKFPGVGYNISFGNNLLLDKDM